MGGSLDKRDFVNKFLDVLLHKGKLKGVEGISDLYLELDSIFEDYQKDREHSFKEYLKFIMEDLHKKYHFRHMGLPLEMSQCPETNCKSITKTISE